LKKYRVFLNGQNLFIELGGNVQKVGFYTSRFVNANSKEQAESLAIDLIIEDARLLTMMRNAFKDPAVFLAEGVSEIEEDSNGASGTDFVFYPENFEL
jgi:hypothetical protein